MTAGFTVALEDVVAGPILAEYAETIRSPSRVVVLLPSLEALRTREAARENKGYGAWTFEQLYDAFANDTPRIGTWLDTSDLTPQQTVEAILSAT